MSDVDNPHQLDKQDLIAAARKLWGPATGKTKNEWRFGAHGSKSIKLDDLVWFDHEDGNGGGIVELCERAGINGSYHEPGRTRDQAQTENWEPAIPPGDAPINMLTCDSLFTYHDANGGLLHYVRRLEHPRRFLPLTWGSLNHAPAAWHMKAPRPPLPLYNLADIRELDPEVILLCEGEKAADAANRKIEAEQLPWIAMSWYGGAGRAKDADVAPLLRTGRKVLIWPDADKPGLAARDVLLGMIPGADSLDVTGLADGYDAANLKAEEKIEDFVRARAPKPQPGTVPPSPSPPPPPPPPGSTASASTATTPTPGPDPADITGWDAIPPPRPQWVVPELIPIRQVTLFSGEGAAGKSTIALHLAAATVLGMGWLVSVPEQGPAFFIDAEDDLDIIHWRLDAIRKLYSTTFAELHEKGLRIWSLAGKDALFTSVDKNKGVIRQTQLYKFFLEQAQIIKPKIIVIASSANVFSGNENDRPQVTLFVNMLKALAIVCTGAVVLVSHPSLQGINSGTGLSGSTQWHNAVRARMVLHGAEDEPNLRELEFQKNQYGPLSEKVVLEWKDGMFLVKPGMNSIDKAARELKAENIFLYLLKARASSGRHLSDRPQSRHYAPKVFATDQTAFEAKLKKPDLEAAMERLFAKGTIRAEPYGPPSDKTTHIVLV